MIVFGTRPEAVKLAPVIDACQQRTDRFKTVICVTGQHREMLDQALTLFGIRPDIDLQIMKPNQGLNELLSQLVLSLGNVFAANSPDLVLVQGDTTTTFAAAVAAYHNKIPVGHVEAGLRTGNIHSPFPEEVNRQLTSRIAHWHFAPTSENAMNLRKEGISSDRIFVTGNTVIDALLSVRSWIENDPERKKDLADCLNRQLGFDVRNHRTIVVTGHRRENFGEGFRQICHALKEIVKLSSDVRIVYPVHLNPNVQEPVNEILKGTKNVKLIPPLDYEPFVYLMSMCYLILTDSGGIQEEAPSLDKPVLVMRDTTERQEAVIAKTVKLVGVQKEAIVSETIRLLNDDRLYSEMAKAHNPYGDGKASAKVVEILANELDS